MERIRDFEKSDDQMHTIFSTRNSVPDDLILFDKSQFKPLVLNKRLIRLKVLLYLHD